jgi:hypothetical protein
MACWCPTLVDKPMPISAVICDDCNPIQYGPESPRGLKTPQELEVEDAMHDAINRNCKIYRAMIDKNRQKKNHAEAMANKASRRAKKRGATPR